MSNVMTFAFRLAWAIALAGGIGEATYDMMKNAARTQRKGLVQLRVLNKALEYRNLPKAER